VSESAYPVRGAFDRAEALEFIDAARIPLRLATLTQDRTPLITSLWFVRRGDSLWCATIDDSSLVQRLSRDPRCGFEVARDAPPYQGVRGQAEAKLVRERGEEVLHVLIERYLGDQQCELRDFLLSRASDEVAVELRPQWLRGWDYADRMRGVSAGEMEPRF
jgi:nitroimidazol reductase NimA-like FMN-containing flavoprotein (pyridoxamine 5'-phosphate oxidase superfamily)